VVAPVKIAPAKLAYVPDATAGKGLYELGDNTRGITACIACHGKEGNSEVLINPNLANQHPQYIEKQLNHFKDSSRKNAIMNQISANLTAADIANIGAYFVDTSAVGEVKASSIVAVKSFIGDINAGKAKSATCAACHGADGNAAISIYPSLAGQSENYLVKQLQDFKKAVDTQGKSGRVNAVMGGMAAILSADDMQNLAAYFASQTHNPVVVDSNEVGKKIIYQWRSGQWYTCLYGMSHN
jgi:cytochrome c553